MRHPGRWVGAFVVLVLVLQLVRLLVTNDAFHWSFVFDNLFTAPVMAGLKITVSLTVLAMLIGVALGIVLAVMRLSPNPVLSGTAFVYTWFFRAVPRLVLCVTFGTLGVLAQEVHLGIPFVGLVGDWFGVEADTTFLTLNMNTLLPAYMAGLLALGLSEGAYMAEIVRAGIESVDEGQTEAAVALGMSRGLAMRRIILPQAMRVIVPPTGNEVIAMLKDTSLVAYVPLADLFFNYEAIGSRTFEVFPALMAAVIWYLLLSSVLLVVQHFIEKRFARGTSRGATLETVTVGSIVPGGAAH